MFVLFGTLLAVDSPLALSAAAMDLILSLMVLVFVSVEAGGHGGHHHSHLRIHLPEFIHHDHHKKVITVHHHHHKPKAHHHHHHHHHHTKPVAIPHGHHYHHHKSKHHATKHLRTITTGHHGHPSHHADNSYHHSQDTYPGYGHHYGPQNDGPTYAHETPSSFENDVSSYSPAAPSFPPVAVVVPKVHGVQHTVKQVKVFDSLPGAFPNSVGPPGYEVTEEGDDDEDDDDTFTTVNSPHDTFPATFGYLHQADAPDLSNAGIPSQLQITGQNHESFSASPQLSSVSADGIESYTGIVDPNQLALTGASNALDQPHSLDNTDLYDHGNSFSGYDTGNNHLGDEFNHEESPISFQRVAGVEQSVHTNGLQTVAY